MKKFFITLLVSIVCLVIIAQYLLAGILKNIATKELNKIISTKVEIGKVGINLLGGITFQINIQNPPGFNEKRFLAVEKGYIKIKLLPMLLYKQIEIQKIFLDNLNINMEINNTSVSNLSLIFKKNTSPEIKPLTAQSNPQKIGISRINEIIVRNGVFKLINYKVNPNGATALFDKINISILNLIMPSEITQMPTSIKGRARLPTRDLIGNIEFSARGNFLSRHVDFNLDLKANKIGLAYFMPFYINTATIFAASGWFDLKSVAKCRDNQLDAIQKVNIIDLELAINKANLKDDLVFGLPVLNVVNFFTINQGRLDFDFKITGTLTDPKFHLTETLQKVLVKSIGDAIVNRLSELPQMLIEKIEKTGDLEEAGKEVLKDIFQQILKPKD